MLTSTTMKTHEAMQILPSVALKQFRVIGSPLDLYLGTWLWVNDWDENGIPDLLVSDFNSYVYVIMADLTGIAEETAPRIKTGLAVTPAINPASCTSSSVESQVMLDKPTHRIMTIITIDCCFIFYNS